jgi:hypothetical protein
VNVAYHHIVEVIPMRMTFLPETEEPEHDSKNRKTTHTTDNTTYNCSRVFGISIRQVSVCRDSLEELVVPPPALDVEVATAEDDTIVEPFGAVEVTTLSCQIETTKQ